MKTGSKKTTRSKKRAEALARYDAPKRDYPLRVTQVETGKAVDVTVSAADDGWALSGALGAASDAGLKFAGETMNVEVIQGDGSLRELRGNW